MRLSVVALLSNLKLPDVFENKTFNGIKLEKQGLQIKKFNDQKMIQDIGEIQYYNEFTKSPCFYFNTEIAPYRFQDLEKMLELRDFVHDALFSLWLTKDNSVNSHVMMSRSDDNKISTNRTPMMFSNSIGEYGKTFFSEDELQEAETWAQLILEMYTNTVLEPTTIKKEIAVGEIVFNNTNKDIQYHKTNRLQRTIQFVTMARKESFLPAKITFYISALESLLSDTNAELRFQVADRSARILGVNLEEKLKISKIITKAYDYRSKYIHGTAGKNASEDLMIEVDDILRRLIKLFLTDLNHVVKMKDEEFRNWLKELLYK
ncbi:HEPN domain-containing protein [Peribacillus simplex]|uniref:HEPN domain-containing protein n=1 Tax=Peribacillus simplex TaxID=1478 RepID=UPI0024C1389F|nr:HEPN domain-containing protein [Peribacillus simplex]WHY54313.1 HEPN domain-containing protein [Peribacillus simplex]